MERPIERFHEWLELAKTVPSIKEPTAMTLATATPDGRPSARIVLLKAYDERGFVFYTNLESRKSEEIKSNAYAALCFYWMPLDRQVRIEGAISPVSDAEADAYFASRPRESQIGAWSSIQSRPMAKRAELEQRIAENTVKFEGKPVPRPPFWSGWRLAPEVIEFWQQIEFRLHDRDIYRMGPKGWKLEKLFP